MMMACTVASAILSAGRISTPGSCLLTVDELQLLQPREHLRRPIEQLPLWLLRGLYALHLRRCGCPWRRRSSTPADEAAFERRYGASRELRPLQTAMQPVHLLLPVPEEHHAAHDVLAEAALRLSCTAAVRVVANRILNHILQRHLRAADETASPTHCAHHCNASFGYLSRRLNAAPHGCL